MSREITISYNCYIMSRVHRIQEIKREISRRRVIDLMLFGTQVAVRDTSLLLHTQFDRNLLGSKYGTLPIAIPASPSPPRSHSSGLHSRTTRDSRLSPRLPTILLLPQPKYWSPPAWLSISTTSTRPSVHHHALPTFPATARSYSATTTPARPIPTPANRRTCPPTRLCLLGDRRHHCAVGYAAWS